MHALAWSVAALLVAVTSAGVWLAIGELRRLGSGRRRHVPLRTRVRDYVGPLERSKRPLNPPLRVTLEALIALCGFPGLGWLLSGHVFVGLCLIVAVPAALLAFYPMYIGVRADPLFDPLPILFAALGVVAVVSSTALAVVEWRNSQTNG